MPVTCGLLNMMLPHPKPCPVIAYLDIVYDFQKRDLVNHISRHADHIFVFSDVWKNHLLTGYGIDEKQVSVFPHGIDETQKFRKMDKREAKKKIGFHPEDFVVFNNNRNSYRKLLDIGIKAFVRFLKSTGCDPRVKYLMNCRVDIEDGYNFRDIIKNICLQEDVDYEKVSSNHIILLSGTAGGCVPDEMINVAMNASDIGINTCGGEGFGLCNAEGAYLGVPQIVTNVGGLSDIFRGFPNMLVEPVVRMTLTAGVDFHNGELAICDYKDFSKKMEFYYSDRESLLEDGKRVEKHVRATYDWDVLLKEFDSSIRRICAQASPNKNVVL
jgi:glycosyltransferase involved in cell wall biosynthesis